MIDTIFAPATGDDWPRALDRLAGSARRAPFDPLAVELVAALSRRILGSPLARTHPALAALAHWFRNSSVRHIATRALETGPAVSVRPRGLVFLMAPANVEVLFIYGWLLSLLAGNATVVRVSQKSDPLRVDFLGLLRDVAADGNFSSALADSWVLTYDHDDAITARISSACDARLVWGGDATVARIRGIALKPVAVDAGFADRFSFAAFSTDRVLRDDEAALDELARRFANDTLWFAQQACSSPRAVFWIGSPAETAQARARFWPRYAKAASAFGNEPAAMVSRVTDVFMLAGLGAIDRLETPIAAFPAVVRGSAALDDVREVHSGHGLFVEYTLDSLARLAPVLHDKDQTLVVHGFDEAEVDALLRSLPNRAIDRIVPPGQATDFATVWDGTDLIDILTRKVNLPSRLAVSRR